MDIALAEMSITDDICFTPLHHVILGLEKADIYQQLRLNNDCTNKPDSLGRSPLHWAIIQGDTNAVEALVSHGASPNSIDKEQMRPLHEVCRAPRSNQVTCAQLLINAGADIDARDSWGRTALRIAVTFTDLSIDLIKLFIRSGADIKIGDIYGQTALLKSIRGSHHATQLLLEHGADIEEGDMYGNTPLSETIFGNKSQCLNLLLQYGAKTDQLLDLKLGRRAREGHINILHFTAWYGNVEVMRALEYSEQHFSLSPRPIDDFEQHRDFRRAHGLSAEDEDRNAFVRLLSTVKYACGKSQYCGHLTDEDDENEEDFIDAKEHV
jgi:ankyrin repeat protein